VLLFCDAHHIRPQFDTTAVAVIITKEEKVAKYEKLASGQELLESWYVLSILEAFV
jgi:ATP-dependent DNA helicase HFM1/MER3